VPTCILTRKLAHQNVRRTSGARDFSCQFSPKIKWLVTCPCAFRLRRLAQSRWRAPGRGIFPVNSRIKIVLVRCPSAFRLRRLAQNVLLASASDVHVHFDGAGSHETVVPLLVPSITVLQEFQGANLEVPVIYEDLDRGLVEILVSRCCEDPHEILSQVLA
jgi:hypothetical protein